MSGLIPDPFFVTGPINRGRMLSAGVGGVSIGAFRHPQDAIGAFTLRFRNLVEGSRVRVEAAGDGTTMDEFVATAAPIQDRTLSLYASGNPRNDLRIKVRNASGVPAYRPFESQAVAQLGTVTVFVFQELDE